MRVLKLSALALICTALATTPARARDIALLIANSAYETMGTLRNPVNDIDRIGRSLQSLGFEVQRATNLRRADMTTALLNFSSQARGADTAMIFYSGHGFEADGVNYLIPIDYAPNHPSEIKFAAIRLDDAMDAVAGATRLSVVVLDACRDNPLASSTRGGSRGLARVTANPSQVVAYSTAPGDVAQDGFGTTSPYTQALAEMMERTPNIDVRQLFTSLSARTTELAQTTQTPYAEFGAFSAQHVSLTGAAATPRPAPQPAPVQNNGEMLALWDAVKDSGDATALGQFAARYPQSALAAEANRRLSALGAVSAQRDSITPPPAAASPAPAMFLQSTPSQPYDGRYTLEMSCSAIRKHSNGFVKNIPVTVTNGSFSYSEGTPNTDGYLQMDGTVDQSGTLTVRGRTYNDYRPGRIRFDAGGFSSTALKASGRRGRRYCEAKLLKQ